MLPISIKIYAYQKNSPLFSAYDKPDFSGQLRSLKQVHHSTAQLCHAVGNKNARNITASQINPLQQGTKKLRPA